MDAAPPIPPRYTSALAATALLSYGALAVFLATQAFPVLRVGSDLRFAISLWFLAFSGPAAICWALRPKIDHIVYVMRLGRALKSLPEPGGAPPRLHLAARRAVWASAGTFGACCWAMAAAIDIGVATGKVDLHGANLCMTSLILCQLGAVAGVVRIVGPALAEIDAVYQTARAHATPHHTGPGTVTQLPRRGA